jgi:hypothetical protein
VGYRGKFLGVEIKSIGRLKVAGTEMWSYSAKVWPRDVAVCRAMSLDRDGPATRLAARENEIIGRGFGAAWSDW